MVENFTAPWFQEVRADIARIDDALERAIGQLTLDALDAGRHDYILGQLQYAADSARSAVHKFIHRMQAWQRIKEAEEIGRGG